MDGRESLLGNHIPVPRYNLADTAFVATNGLACFLSVRKRKGAIVRIYKITEAGNMTMTDGVTGETVDTPMAKDEYVDLYVTDEQVITGTLRLIMLEGR